MVLPVVDINQDGYEDFYICKSGNKNTPLQKDIIIFSSTMATTPLRNPRLKWDWMMTATMYRLLFSIMIKTGTLTCTLCVIRL
jgi:hypothetical protein